MRKIIIIAFLILAAAITGIFYSMDDDKALSATAHTTKVGVLLSGSHTDKNYCQAHYEALEALRPKDKLNLDIVYRENVAGDCYPDIISLIRDEGCRIIVGVSFQFGKDMERAAEMYPDVYFLHTGGTSAHSNFSSFFGRMYQARYLLGIIAGSKTKTGQIGYVAAFPIPEVIRGINAFTLGVRSVRPDAVVRVRYCNSWTDDEAAGKACAELLERHPIDVMAMHTNSLAPHREADRRGVWSVGCNRDSAEAFPDTYLAACVWQWRDCYYKQILDCLQGKFHGSNVWMDINDGIVALSAPTRHVDARAMAAVEAANRNFYHRTFDVFYGPVKDNTGNIRIEAGESMADSEMLNGFFWYVEGVTVEGI